MKKLIVLSAFLLPMIGIAQNKKTLDVAYKGHNYMVEYNYDSTKETQNGYSAIINVFSFDGRPGVCFLELKGMYVSGADAIDWVKTALVLRQSNGQYKKRKQ